MFYMFYTTSNATSTWECSSALQSVDYNSPGFGFFAPPVSENKIKITLHN